MKGHWAQNLQFWLRNGIKMPRKKSKLVGSSPSYSNKLIILSCPFIEIPKLNVQCNVWWTEDFCCCCKNKFYLIIVNCWIGNASQIDFMSLHFFYEVKCSNSWSSRAILLVLIWWAPCCTEEENLVYVTITFAPNMERQSCDGFRKAGTFW